MKRKTGRNNGADIIFRYFNLERALLFNKPTLNDLIKSCPDSSKRTIQADLEAMRYSDELQFYAPIVYDKKTKTYSYSDKKYSIMKVIKNRFYKRDDKN